MVPVESTAIVKPMDGLGPYLGIWVRPRATIREILAADPTRHVIALAAIGPALQALAAKWSLAIASPGTLATFWPLQVAFSVVVQAVAGVVLLYLVGWLWAWSGRLLGGTASAIEVRASVAWAQVPTIVAAAIAVVAALDGVAISRFATGGFLAAIRAHPKFSLIEAVLGWWGFIVSLKTLGEVHGFSAWRALGAVLIGIVAIVAAGAVIAGFAVAMIHALR